MTNSPSVLFVCLGNICRSPLAEAAMRHEAERAGLTLVVDSAGTANWHVGSPPDPRSCAEAARHGIDISTYRGRHVQPEDFLRFTRIVALDAQNLRDLLDIRPANATAQLSLLLDHVPGRTGQGVADPYYGEAEGFARTWEDARLGAQGILAEILKA